jgi:lysophospholipid acyltransferase (LPLAT)-like uncharacterized protein
MTKSAEISGADRRRGRILGTIAWLVGWLLARTLRWTVIGQENVDRARSTGNGRLAWASWHGRQLLTVDFHASGKRGMKVVVLASMSRDGEIQTAALERWGYRVERGSSTRGAARGLLAMARAMREGWEPAIAVDGPVGPLHGVKQGIVALAKHESARIIPTMASASSCWIVSSWDRTFIPKPFSRAVMLYGEPVEVPEGADDTTIEALRAGLEATLREMTARADLFFGPRAAKRLAAAHASADERAAARAGRKAARKSAEQSGERP